MMVIGWIEIGGIIRWMKEPEERGRNNRGKRRWHTEDGEKVEGNRSICIKREEGQLKKWKGL